MYRRHRPRREIAFSFDSFLDVVANVCGIIIRLILVAWVGGRSYHAVMAKQEVESALPETESALLATAATPLPAIADPLEPELQRHKDELARQQKFLLEQLRQWHVAQAANGEASQKLAMWTSSAAAADQERLQLERKTAGQAGGVQTAKLSLADLVKRSQQLAAELRELEKLPPQSKVLRYRTPVSRPVHTEELHFECQNGRVSFIDVQAFLVEVRRGLEDKVNLLKTQWEVEGNTGTVGAFRMHYVVERERGVLDGSGGPSSQGGFSYGMSGWIVEPVTPARGEPGAVALAPGSNFRRLVDAIDPEQTVVTMWVYPDSFELYRQLRDLLHERNVEVAGRPLPLGLPIASSRRGTASRGQ